MKYNINNTLWLTWKEPETSERFVIGLLTYNNNKYYFEYLQDEGKNNLEEAMKKGFKLLPAFPEEKKYESDTLFYTFLNRLPNRKRKVVQELVKENILSENFSDFDLLKETGGRLPTDPFEFLIPISFVEIENLNLSFYIVGTKYHLQDDIVKMLDEKTELYLELDPNNNHDLKAIKITKDNQKIGYVPRCYNDYIFEYVEKNQIKGELEKIYNNYLGEKNIKIRIFGCSV